MAQIGQIGLPLTVTFKNKSDNAIIDISSASAKTIIVKKPSGDTEEFAGAYVTDGSDGQLKYVTVEGDLDEIGIWYIQGYYEKGGVEAHTEWGEFEVYGNITN